jgi:transcriptional regulator with XRE-family HTH domain
MSDDILNNVIKEARIRRNIKQEDVAKFVGVTVQTYSKWENDKTEPKASQINKLSEILKVTEKEICSGKISNSYDLEFFMKAMSNIHKGTDGWNQLIATYNSCDHDEYLKNLEEQCKINENNSATKFSGQL